MDFCPVVAGAESVEFITNPSEFATMQIIEAIYKYG